MAMGSAGIVLRIVIEQGVTSKTMLSFCTNSAHLSANLYRTYAVREKLSKKGEHCHENDFFEKQES
jgi:hypothetical protein